MKRTSKKKGIIVFIVFLAILGLLGYYAVTILMSTGVGKNRNIKLGLDLAGGVSITYQVVGDTPTEEQMSDTIYKLQQRIENDLGSESTTTEANVYKVGDNRITVEIPGVTDANAILDELGTPGALCFISQTDSAGNENYSYDSTTGSYKLNYDLATLEKNGSVVLSGSEVKSATATYQTNQTTNSQEPIVQISLDKEGTTAFATATTAAQAKGESIGIYYDGKFVSVPNVNTVITDGNCIIEGMKDYDEAENLASYIRIGGLDIQLKELQSEVVGAQLGNDALSTSLTAGICGLAIVVIFLMIAYLLPGVVASMALALYTTLIISILYLFDITLTLPGIAGIILSIGMAVDANVIIFARIKEELAAGKSVANAVEVGFKKALSAILDGNITTLIAAAVLGVMGSGTVKGFAITLALGVIVSLFTALFVTQTLLKAFIAMGVTNPKVYGIAKKHRNLNFVGKKAVFFTISLTITAIGCITMGVNTYKGNKALNYSLEFMGGTSTTANFNKSYTIGEIEKEMVPYVTEITKDNDIQTQTVADENKVIFKTRTLSLKEREAFNTMLEDKFGVKETSISSENISSTISGELRRQSILAVIISAFFMMMYIWIRFKDLRFGSSAIIALLHDVFIVITLYAVLRLSVSSAFIACILTVIGYSINDTIIIFDRIRENLHKLRTKDADSLKELVNESITQTLSRSISTSFTTVITVFMLLILGVATVQEFALPLLVGIICGTYSSICIAAELWYLMRVYIKRKDEKKGNKKLAPKKKVRATKENDGLVV